MVIGLAFIMMLGTFGVTLIHQLDTSVATAATEAMRPIPQIQHAVRETSFEELLPVAANSSKDGSSFSADADPIETSESALTSASLRQADTKPEPSWFAPLQFDLMLPWIVAVWIAGVVVFSLRMLWGLRRIHIYRALAEEPADPDWNSRFTALRKALHVSGAVRLLASSAVPCRSLSDG